MTEADQTAFLVMVLAESIRWMHVFLVGQPDDLKELKRREFFEESTVLLLRKDLDRHFKHMVRLFYKLGADISLK